MSTDELSKTFQPLFDLYLDTISQLKRISDDQWMHHTKTNQKELSGFSTSKFYLSHLSKN